ncbi:hypothetical protein J6590_085280 [Homalodisca vitripennis]|nr:hypothetical protein J6590_085280 [Homalodisca vitripennis]
MGWVSFILSNRYAPPNMSVKKAITELAEGSKKRDAEEDIKLETKKSKVDEPTSTESSCPNIVDITRTLEVVNKGQSCVNRKDDHLSKNENMDTNANSSPGCSFWTSECVKNTDIMYKKGSLYKNSDKTIENLDSSLWESVKTSDDPSDMKVRLCKIKNNTEKIDTLKEYSDGDEVIDDTDADSDFVYSSSSSEDESFTERYQRNKKKTVALRREKNNSDQVEEVLDTLDNETPALIVENEEPESLEEKKGRKPKAEPNKWMRNLKKKSQ